MRKIQIKLKPLLVAVVLLITMSSGVGLAYANPPGNNGTIKMDGSDLDSNANDNDPHLACNLTVQWFGFDVGSRNTTVEFDTQSPTPTGSEHTLLTDTPVTFQGNGSGNTLDHSETYNLSNELSGYTPQAQQGYHIKVTVTTDGSQGNDTKSKVFWVEPCVTPVKPDFTFPSCQVKSKTVTPPSITGVVWDPSGPTVLNSGNPTVTYNATPAPGYAFPDGVETSWTFNYVPPDANCGEVIGTNIEVIGDPTFTDATCKLDGSYTVVAQEGVIYKDENNVVINPGTYTVPSGTTVKIFAYPDQGFVLDENAQTLWTHTFNAPQNCGQVLGESTEVGGSGGSTSGDPQVLGTSTTLTNTGTSPVPLSLLALFFILLTIGVYNISPRKPVKKQIEVHFL